MIFDWRFFALASAFFAALTAIFGKIGVTTGTDPINSNLATFLRTIVILAVSALLVSVRQEWKWPADTSRRAIVFLILSGLATGASWLCYYRALQLGPASKVAPLDKLSVALVIVLAIVFLGEELSLKTAIGGLLVVAGSVVLAL